MRKPTQHPPNLCRFRVRVAAGVTLIPAFSLALLLAYLLRFDGDLRQIATAQFPAVLATVLIVKVGVFSVCRVTRSWHSFASFTEMKRLARATLIATAALGLVCFLLGPRLSIPRSIILIDACLTGSIVAGWLFLRRSLREHRERDSRRGIGTPVVIVGVGATSDAVLKVIDASSEPHLSPVGIISDHDRMVGRDIAGIPIIGTLDDAAESIRAVGAQTVLVVQGQLSGTQVQHLIDDCRERHVDVRIIPSVEQLLAGRVDVRPRQVAIEDVLGRAPIQLDQDGLRGWLDGKTVLVTGSCGSIGSEIARQLLTLQPARLVLVDRSENGQFFLGQELADHVLTGLVEIAIGDATDAERISALFDEHRPDVVFHAAAYKHVPLMESHPGEAVKNIVQATKILADAAHASGCEAFVMISTDKAVNPTNVMGCCKRVAELYVQAMARQSDTRFITVRFGNVLGSNGSVIPIFRQQIAAGGPVTVTHPDMTRYFMTIPEASQLVIQAGTIGQGGEIFVLDMGQPVKILDLATEMIRLSGLTPGTDIEIAITGLRPGEKMYEELYTDDEHRSATTHPKILCAHSEQMELFVIRGRVSKLMKLVHHHPNIIRDELCRCVPRYQSTAATSLRAA